MALWLPLRMSLSQLIQVERTDDAALHCDISGFVQSGDFPDAVFLFVAVAVFGHGHFHPDVAAFLEASLQTIGVARPEIDEEVELHVGSVALCCHRIELGVEVEFAD